MVAKRTHTPNPDCRSWSSVYNTGEKPSATNSSLEAWHANACPWEGTRHSGFYNGWPTAIDAQQYADEHHACPPHRSERELERLAGRRIYFVGDSVMRQFAQSFLCRIRNGGRVIADTTDWSTPHRTQWGRCQRFSGTYRHCYMRDGCVTFAIGQRPVEDNVVVCFHRNEQCKANWALEGGLRDMLDTYQLEHGSGSHTFVVTSNGMHWFCNELYWLLLNHTYNEPWLAQGRPVLQLNEWRWRPRRASLPPPNPNVTVVYKDLDATHFPTKTGTFDPAAPVEKRFLWRCQYKRGGRQPQRDMEVRTSLSVVRRLGWEVLETFEASRLHGAPLHATHASVPSREYPVDCLHWMLPGVPDTWTEKLLAKVLLPP